MKKRDKRLDLYIQQVKIALEDDEPSDTDEIPLVKRKPGRPKKQGIEDEIRATMIIKKQMLEKLKDIAYWDRLLIKNVIQNAINQYLDDYEVKKGPILPRKTK